MKTFNNFLILLIALMFIGTGVLSQSGITDKALTGSESGQILSGEEMILQRLKAAGLSTELKLKADGNKSIDELCAPNYTSGCSPDGDGFTDFAVEQIQNYNNGCADNTGIPGWSTYHNLGPALLTPGMTHTFTFAVGFSSQYVNIWIDFNDDEILTMDEMILQDYFAASSGILYNVDVTIPANANPGIHKMRAMAVYASPFTDPCGSYYYGEAEDYTVQITVPSYGTLQGLITQNTGGAPIPGALVSVANGMFTATSDATGFYQINNILVGTWDAAVNVTGYNPASATVTINNGVTTTQNFALTAPILNISPSAINIVVDPYMQDTETITVANNGDGAVVWTAQIDYLSKGTDNNTLQYNNSGLTKDVIASEAAMKSEIIAEGVSVPIDQLKDPNFPLQLGSQFVNPKNYMSSVNPENLDDIDIIGGLDNSWFIGPRTRGNLFTCTDSKVLVEFMMYLEVVSNPTQMWMLIYEGEMQAGIYDLTVAIDITPAPIGTGWVSSGVINYLLEENKYYMIVASFEQACSYYASTTVSPFPYPVAFGLATAGAGYDWAPTSIFPPDVFQDVPSYTFGNPTLYYQQLVTAAPEFWLSINPSSGTINPGSNNLMTVSFDALDYPAGTTKTANIVFTSNPDVGTITVPVSMTVGSLQFGNITGTVTLSGLPAYNIGDVTEVVIQAGPYSTNPDATGAYNLSAYPGTYDVSATLYGYTQQVTPGVVVNENLTTPNINFIMPSIYGRIMGTVTDFATGDPIENATVTLVDTDFEVMTAIDGTYQVFVEAGSYDVIANHPTYKAETATGVVVDVEDDTILDFELEFQVQCVFTVELWDDYGDGWNGGTLTVYVNGNAVLNNITLTSGSGPALFSFDVGTGDIVTTTFTPGGWPYECSYYIYNNNSEVVFSDGVGGVNPTGGTFTAVCVVFTYGDLTGTVTELSTGNPVAGAVITVYNSTGVSAADGTYLIEDVMTGTWAAFVNKSGYNIASATVTIIEDQLTTQNFILTAPVFNISPSSVTITLEPNETGSETIMLSNTGNGPVNWNANLSILSKDETDGGFTQTSYPLYAEIFSEFNLVKGISENSSGRATSPAPHTLKDYQIKLDPNSTAYAYNAYDPFSSIPEGPITFTLNNPGVLNPFGSAASDFVATADWVNDVWYGVVYGGTWITIDMVTGIPTVIGYCADFTGIAYDWTTQTMYGVDFNGGLYTVNLATGASTLVATTQTYLITLVCTNEGNLYGFDLNSDTFGSIDKVTGQWTSINYVGFDFGYAQDACVDHSTNTIYWACYDVNLGGVLLTVDAQTGVTSFIGAFQNGAEITGFAIPGALDTWVTIDTYSGVLNAGDSFPFQLNFDATDMLPGVFEAEITFTTNPNVGPTVVDVTMIVEGLIPPVNLNLTHSCTDVNLTWQMPTGGDADSWNVYRNGNLLGNTNTMSHGDLKVMPAQEHCYQVRAVYDGEESMPTAPACITVPTPVNLQPLTLQGQHLGGGNVQLTWVAPNTCLAPDEYKIFRNNTLIATADELQYLDQGLTTGNYEYFLKAVYYFGESNNSTPTYVMVVITDLSEISDDQIKLYPNPASDLINLESGTPVISVDIFSNSGQLVRSQQVNASKAQIDVWQFEPGLYYFKLNTTEGTALKKVLVD